jgi:hypothetical protein
LTVDSYQLPVVISQKKEDLCETGKSELTVDCGQRSLVISQKKEDRRETGRGKQENALIVIVLSFP